MGLFLKDHWWAEDVVSILKVSVDCRSRVGLFTVEELVGWGPVKNWIANMLLGTH